MRPDVDVFGLGGAQFAAAGGRQIADYRELSVNGLFEVVGKIPQLAAARSRIVAAADATPPDVFVPIDFWGFNYRLAQAMRTRGVPVVYYISPQLWASRPWRMKSMRADRVARAGDLSVRGIDLPKRRCAGGVRRPSAGRDDDRRRGRAGSFSRRGG